LNYAQEAQKLRNWVATQSWLSDMDKDRYTEWAEEFELKAKEQLNMTTQIIDNPPKGWMRNLVQDCHVWLTKEKTTATVVAPFNPPVGAHRTGQMFIRVNGRIDYWFVSEDGRGIDGSRLMQPLEGNLPDEPASLQSPEAHELKLEIARLRKDLNKVMAVLSFLGIDFINVPEDALGVPKIPESN